MNVIDEYNRETTILYIRDGDGGLSHTHTPHCCLLACMSRLCLSVSYTPVSCVWWSLHVSLCVSSHLHTSHITWRERLLWPFLCCRVSCPHQPSSHAQSLLMMTDVMTTVHTFTALTNTSRKHSEWGRLIRGRCPWNPTRSAGLLQRRQWAEGRSPVLLALLALLVRLAHQLARLVHGDDEEEGADDPRG